MLNKKDKEYIARMEQSVKDQMGWRRDAEDVIKNIKAILGDNEYAPMKNREVVENIRGIVSWNKEWQIEKACLREQNDQLEMLLMAKEGLLRVPPDYKISPNERIREYRRA